MLCSSSVESLDYIKFQPGMLPCLADDAPTYVNGQLIGEETVLHHVSVTDS